MRPQERDLFGEVIVTHADIRLWLETVPRINPDGPRAAHYIRHWDVPQKVIQAKLEGRFEACTAVKLFEPESAAWWSRMCWV